MGLTRLRAEQIGDIDYKQAVRVITTTDITLSGGAPNQVDGVNLSVDDRILVTGQSVGNQNGIYQVQTVGTGSSGTWIRSLDTNATGELQAGTIVMVTEGNVYADTQWKLTTNNPIVIGTTPLTFEQNSAYAFGNIYANGTAVLANSVGSTVTFTAGNNIAITGNNTSKTVTIGVTGFDVSSNSISNGTSNVNVVSSGGNITIGVGGTSNVAVFATANIVASANLLPAANVTYNLGSTSARWKDLWLSNSTLYLGDTAIATTAGVLTVNGANVLTGNAGSALSTTGNITGGNVLTGGLISATSTITSAANVIGSNIVTAGIVTATGNITGGNVSATNLTGTLTTAAQPNITGVGTLSALSVSGNVQGGNLRTAGLISATGNITGANLTINGSAVITGNLSVSGTETIFNVANLTVNDKDIIVANNVTGSANVDGAGIQAGNPGVATWFYNNATLSWQSNVGITPTTNGTLSLGGASNFWGNAFLTTASVTGNVQGGNIRTAGLVSATGAITGASVVGGVMTGSSVSVTGAVTGASVVGGVMTGTSVSVTGNVTGGNIATAGLITATGNITGNYIFGNGSQLTGISGGGTPGGANTQIQFNDASSFGGSAAFTFNKATNAVATTGTFSATGNVTGGNILTAGLISATGTVTGSVFSGAGTNLTGTAASLTVGAATSATTAGTVTTAAQPNITSVGTLTSLNSGVISSSGNVTGANLLTAGLISATGNLTAGNVSATNLTGTILTASQTNITSVGTLGALSVTGNVQGGNIRTAGLISATGAVTGAAITGTSLTVSTGNVTAGNLLLSGAILDSAQLDIQTTASNANIALAPNGTGIVTVSTQVSAVGNITGGNIIASGASGNITGANVISATTINATGTITGGAMTTAGAINAASMTATGTVLWGSAASRTQTKDDAGSIASKSGFFETASPTNYYAGATSWQHMLESRHSNDANNYALQIAGSFFDQLLYFRKTNNSATTAWSKFAVEATTPAFTGITNSGSSGTGNIGASGATFNTIFAKATSAQYADLAEMYCADTDYSPGTVVEFGGSHEITISSNSHSTKIAGIISTNPSYLMNSAQVGDYVLPVALTGRVPCQVVGTICKGDRLVASKIPGVATVLDSTLYQPGSIIGKALENYDSKLIGVIEVVVGKN
jgi:hypothetical protein